MMIDKDSLKVDGVSWAEYLVEVGFGYHKIWSKDTGRNQKASFGGTIKGIFPKLTLYFGELTQAQVEAIVPILDKQYQTVEYYDPNLKSKTTMPTYAGDYEIKYKGLVENGANAEGFSVALISTDPRE